MDDIEIKLIECKRDIKISLKSNIFFSKNKHNIEVTQNKYHCSSIIHGLVMNLCQYMRVFPKKTRVVRLLAE